MSGLHEPGERSERHDAAWLRTLPPLDELQEAFPDDWAVVERELAALTARGQPDELRRLLDRLMHSPRPSRAERRAAGQEGLQAAVRRQMMTAALEALLLRAATGVERGRIRFGLVNGYIAQRLLFARDLERKPVSRTAFRLIWPLLRQRRLLMPLVQPKGIYCFYSKQLVRRLARMIGDRPCLEIAAGDGTLARFLRDVGVTVTATDDHSWSHAVEYPADVLHQDARTALREHRPAVVLCSWPPPDNPFEAEVFETPSVQTYIVINSRQGGASGDRGAYTGQTTFRWAERPELSALVLPPELESIVEVFERVRPGDSDEP